LRLGGYELFRLIIYEILFAKMKILLIIMSLSFFISHSDANPEYQNMRGPFRIRNQFPATLPFLSLAADDAYYSRQGQWQVTINYSHANTFTRSAGILSQFSGEDDRIAFNPVNITSDNRSNGLYYIDSGTGSMSLQLTYSLLNHLSLSLEIPIIKYYGGFLDVPIETFHKLVGYPYNSRAMMSANNTHFYLSLNDDFYLSADQLSTPGIGDLVFIVKKYLLSEEIYRPAFAVRFATKLPTGDVGSYKFSRRLPGRMAAAAGD
jgi:hypothetical protein